MDAPPSRAAGTVIDGRLRLDARLEGWGVGECWRAQEIASGRAVVVKLVAPGGARRAERTGALRLLGDRLAKLQHPDVLAVTAHGTQRGQVYFVHPWFEGESLSARLRALAAGGARLPVGHARWIAERLAEAVAAVHRHAASFLHGALTPDAVRVAWSEHGPEALRVHDIGLWLEAAATPTPATAPELRRESPTLHPTSDVYALASVASQLLAAALFEAPLDLDAPVETRLHALRAEAVDDALWSLLARSMAHETHERPGSVDAFLTALREAPWPAEAVAQADDAAGAFAPLVMPELPQVAAPAVGFADPPQPLKPLEMRAPEPEAPVYAPPPEPARPYPAPVSEPASTYAAPSFPSQPSGAHQAYVDDGERTENVEHLRHLALPMSLDEAENTALVMTQHEFDRTSADMPAAPPAPTPLARAEDTLNVSERWPAAPPPPRASTSQRPPRRQTLMAADEAESTMDVTGSSQRAAPVDDGTRIIPTPGAEVASTEIVSRAAALAAASRSGLSAPTMIADDATWSAPSAPSMSAPRLDAPTWASPQPAQVAAPQPAPWPSPLAAPSMPAPTMPAWHVDPYAQVPSSMGTTPLGAIPGWVQNSTSPPAKPSRMAWVLVAVLVVMGVLSFLVGTLLYSPSSG